MFSARGVNLYMQGMGAGIFLALGLTDRRQEQQAPEQGPHRFPLGAFRLGGFKALCLFL